MRDSDERREKRKRTIIGVIIAAVMILSTFGFVLNYAGDNAGHSEEYKGIKFEQSGNTVVAKINGKLMSFNYFPSQLEYINVSSKTASLLSSTPTFFVTSDPQDVFAESIDMVSLYLTTALPEVKDVYPVAAFTNSTGFVRPEISCLNATDNVPVVHIFRSNTTSISGEGGCISVAAQSAQDVLRIGEKLTLVILGVTDG